MQTELPLARWVDSFCRSKLLIPAHRSALLIEAVGQRSEPHVVRLEYHFFHPRNLASSTSSALAAVMSVGRNSRAL